MKSPSKTFQNLPYFCIVKIHVQNEKYYKHTILACEFSYSKNMVPLGHFGKHK